MLGLLASASRRQQPGQTEEQTSDVTKLMFAFRNSANAPESNSVLADIGVILITLHKIL